MRPVTPIFAKKKPRQALFAHPNNVNYMNELGRYQNKKQSEESGLWQQGKILTGGQQVQRPCTVYVDGQVKVPQPETNQDHAKPSNVMFKNLYLPRQNSDRSQWNTEDNHVFRYEGKTTSYATGSSSTKEGGITMCGLAIQDYSSPPYADAAVGNAAIPCSNNAQSTSALLQPFPILDSNQVETSYKSANTNALLMGQQHYSIKPSLRYDDLRTNQNIQRHKEICFNQENKIHQNTEIRQSTNIMQRQNTHVEDVNYHTSIFQNSMIDPVSNTNINRSYKRQATQNDMSESVEVKGKKNKIDVDRSMKLITCTIEGMKHWCTYQMHGPMLFCVLGTTSSAVTVNKIKSRHDVLLLDEKDTIKCIYYSIDRPMPKVIRGQTLRCVGRFDVESMQLHCLSIRLATEAEKKHHKTAVNSSDNFLRHWIKHTSTK